MIHKDYNTTIEHMSNYPQEAPQYTQDDFTLVND